MGFEQHMHKYLPFPCHPVAIATLTGINGSQMDKKLVRLHIILQLRYMLQLAKECQQRNTFNYIFLEMLYRHNPNPRHVSEQPMQSSQTQAKDNKLS